MERPQSKIQNTEASSIQTEDNAAGLRSLQDEIHSLRNSQPSSDSKVVQNSPAAAQLASLEIVDERKNMAEPVETKPAPQEVQAAPSKDASDTIKEENTPATSSFDNPYTHISIAGQAMREIQELLARDGNELLIVYSDNGEKTELSVAKRIELLTQSAEQEFKDAIKAADGINQTKVEATLFDVRARMESTSTDEEKAALAESETALESLKHSPSATRFAFAMFIAGNGQLDTAFELLKEAERRDPEAALDSNFLQFKNELEAAIGDGRKTMINKEEFMLPLITMSLGDGERQAGNVEMAEQHYLDAIKQADDLNQMDVKDQLDQIEQEKADFGDDPEALKELEAKEMAWAAVAHASALSRISYADFLISQGRGNEAHEILLRVQEIDPNLVNDKQEFKDMLELSAKVQSAADLNPFQHLENFTKALDDLDIDQARAELKEAVNAADNLDRDLARKNKVVVAQQLKTETDPTIRDGLSKAYEIYDAFEHAASFTRIVLGRFELAAKNYNQAKELFLEAQEMDPSFVAREEIEFEKLMESAEEPSTFSKILDFTANLAKELVADAAAVIAGAAAVVLTGWSGPGAVVAGAAAGAGTYTTVKWLMGDEIYWYTPLWGAIDGATGSVAALARRALVVEGGKLMSKEVAEAAVLKSGGEIASLSGLEGFQMAEAAQKIASSGLRTMGKDIGLWSRFSSSIPFIGTGNAEYRAALGAYRSLSYSNFGIQAGVNAGTAAAASIAYRGAHESINYYNGMYESFGAFVSAYGESVFKDTLTGVVMGAYVNSWKDGISMSAIVNGVSAGLSDPTSVVDYMNKFAQKTSTDLAFGSVAWVVGIGASAADRYLYLGALSAVQNSFSPSIPLWSEAYYTRESIRNVIAPALVALQTPPATAEEFAQNYESTPGSEWVPTTAWTA